MKTSLKKRKTVRSRSLLRLFLFYFSFCLLPSFGIAQMRLVAERARAAESATLRSALTEVRAEAGPGRFPFSVEIDKAIDDIALNCIMYIYILYCLIFILVAGAHCRLRRFGSSAGVSTFWTRSWCLFGHVLITWWLPQSLTWS